eukprot:4302805-Amphidinium_carterae.1
MSLIPKGGDSNTGAQPPGKLRPISVLPQVARVWSQLRFQDIMEKILPSVLGCQHGGLPRKQARTIAARLLVRMDASARDRHLGGKGNFCFAQLDLRKYFNCINCCLCCGDPVDTVGNAGRVRSSFELTLLPDGCQDPLPLGFPGQGLLHAERCAPGVPGLDMKQLSVYLDDVTVEASSREQLTAVVQACHDVFAEAGLELNLPKCHWSSGSEESLAPLELRTGCVEFAGVIDVLGVDVWSPWADAQVSPTKRSVDRMEVVTWRLSRAAHLPTAPEVRATVVASSAMSPFAWSPVGPEMSDKQQSALDAQVWKAILGSHSQWKRETAWEIFYSCVFPGHRLVPHWIRLHSAVGMIMLAVSEGEDIGFWLSGLAAPPKCGLLAALSSAATKLAITVRDDIDGFLEDGDGREFHFACGYTCAAMHQLRDFIRAALVARVAKRRPREFAGLEEG